MPASARPLNSWDLLKIIALLLMFVDHTGNWILRSDDQQYWLRAVGRGAAPIFMFLTGYASTYRFKWDLLALALLLSLSDLLLAHRIETQNILFTILIARMIFRWLEKRGQIITRPYEWYAGSVALFMISAVLQYGSIGFLYALCGYLQRRPEHYAYPLRRNFMILTFVTYGIFYAIFAVPPINFITLAVTLLCVYWLLAHMKIRDIHAPWCPSWLKTFAKAVSAYSGYIYVFHLIALEWITGISL